MSEQVVVSKASSPGLGRALAGVVFSDFIGVLLFALPRIGWLLGLAVMVAISPVVAWLALDEHPKRRVLTVGIGICNAVALIGAAIALVVYTLFVSGVQFG